MSKKQAHSVKFIFVLTVSILLIGIISLLISVDCFFGINRNKVLSFFGADEFALSAENYPLSVHFIDVGCGDSILIRSSNKTILIDTGSYSLTSKSCKYLRKNNIKNIDLFVATHTDSDHIGDFVSIAENFDIKNLWLNENACSNSSERTESEKIFFDEISKKSIKVTSPKIGIYDFGEFKLNVLSPSKKYDSQNDNSIVIKLEYKNVSYLFTGDSGEKAEAQMLSENTDLKSTVLKLSHHGSNGATTQKFLDAVSPQYVIISAGEENIYLPNRETVSRVIQSKAKIYRTDEYGTIILATDGSSSVALNSN